MRIVGLDIGYTTGICFLEHSWENIKGISTYVVSTSKRDNSFVFECAKVVEKRLKYLAPDFVVIEDYAYSGAGFFNVYQAEIQAQIKRWLYDNRIEFYSGAASTIKMTILNKGNANKGAVRAWGRKFLEDNGKLTAISRKPKDKIQHVYDALLMAVYGWMIMTNQVPISQTNKFMDRSVKL